MSPLHSENTQKQYGKLSTDGTFFSPKLQNRAEQQQCVYLKAGPLQKHGSREFSLLEPLLRSWWHCEVQSGGVIVSLTRSVQRQVFHREAEASFTPSLAAVQMCPCAHTSGLAANFTQINAIIFRNEMPVKSLGNEGNASLAPKVSAISVKGK